MRTWLLMMGIVGLFLAGGVRASAGVAPDTLRVSQFTGSVLLFDHAALRITSPITTRADMQGLPARPFRPNLVTDARYAYWLNVFLHNDTGITQTLYMSASENQLVTLYRIIGTYTDSVRCGYRVPTPGWPAPENEKYAPVTLAKAQTASLWIRVANEQGLLPRLTQSPLPRPLMRLQLMTETTRTERLLWGRQTNALELQTRSWVEGALIFFLFFVTFIFARYPRRLYGYYALYVLAGCTYALLKTRSYTPMGHWLGQIPWAQAHLLDPVIWAGWGAYLFFLIELLMLNKSHPLAARRIRWFARMAVAYSIVFATLMLLTNDGGVLQIGFWLSRSVFVTAHVVILVWTVWAVPSPLTRYVLLGNVLLTTVGVVASLMQGKVLTDDYFLIAELRNLMMLSFGILLEIVVFALALAYRIRLIDAERVTSQQAYIDELEQRTIYEKRIAEVEMLALRSQMNPHFLFNSLNTIEYFVLKGDEEKATRYLSNFSRLLRLTLNHSNENTVRLSEEITGLKLYLDLEATRFGDEFRYVIEADARIDQDEVMLPPLLLQPFVENAIWHGLRQSQRPDKRLWIRLLMQDSQTLQFEIEDNGIGRQQAADLKSRSATQRKSYGMDITRQRMELFNRNYPSQISIDLIDLNTNGQTGTLIRMTYQLNVELVNE
ncbi:MAG: histidine kinase [Spirosoma sp.]|nr:histidine kinase [Spirosoma sp.]